MSDSYLINTEDFWQANSTLRLCVVPWSQTEDAVEWGYGEAGVAKRDAYLNNLDSLIISSGNSYIHLDTPVPIEVPYDVAFQYNYLVVDNPEQPVEHYGDKGHVSRYCYFISGHTMDSPLRTSLSLELDVITTYRPYLQITSMLCEKGQVQFANNATQAAMGSHNVSNAVVNDDGLDIGNTYFAYDYTTFDLSNKNDCVGVLCAINISGSLGNKKAPEVPVAHPTYMGNLPSGCQLVLFPMYADSDLMEIGEDNAYVGTFFAFCDALSNYSWVAQGIQALYYVPGALVDAYRDALSKSEYSSHDDLKAVKTLPITGAVPYIYGLGGFDISPDRLELFTLDWDSMTSVGIPDRYRFIPALRCYPYTVIELSNYEQTPVEIRPEEIGSENGAVSFDMIYSMYYPSNQAVVFPRYTRTTASEDFKTHVYTSSKDTSGEVTVGCGSDIYNGLWFKNFPTFTYYNDNAQLALANNIYNYQYSYAAADWAYTSSMAAANLSYQISNSQYDLTDRQASETFDTAQNIAKRNYDTAETNAKTAQNAQAGAAFGNMVSAAGSGNVAGAIGGGVSAASTMYGDYDIALNTATNTQNIALINASLALTQSGERTTLGRENNTKNLGLAQNVAKGNRDLAWKQIETQKKNASLTPPSAVAAVTGNAFKLATGRMKAVVSTLHPNQGAIARAGDYMLRFGCGVNKLINMPESLLVCERFTFWKGVNLTFKGNLYINETNRNVIRALFRSGITFWNNPDDIEEFGPDILYSNTPIYGDYYDVV